jgi:hypothetical protein
MVSAHSRRRTADRVDAQAAADREQARAAWALVDIQAAADREQQARGQVMGQDILRMLNEQPLVSASCDSARLDHDDTDVDVKVIVKHGFIEVVDPTCRRRLNRSMSDSALLNFASDSEQPWQKISSDKWQGVLSDASTTISSDVEDNPVIDGGFCSVPCWSDDEWGVTGMAYQYVESWWIPMGFDPSTTVLMPDGSTMPSASFMDPSQWADQSNMDCADVEAVEDGQEWRTTVMLRNMPNNYTRDMLLELVNSMGFSGCYDFAYLPVDFKSQAGLGYAFINFVSTSEAQRCFDCFEGFSGWKVPSEKVCTVTWGSPYQGLEAHIERYQNSPVMHHSIPDEWKPVLVQQGERIPFPAPTKPIKTPKVRQQPAAMDIEF